MVWPQYISLSLQFVHLIMSQNITPAIPKGSLVVVTGVNGYVASHVADQLLTAGYKVRGTVRSVDKSHWINEVFEKRYGGGKFETVVVEDMIHDGAFDEVVKGL